MINNYKLVLGVFIGVFIGSLSPALGQTTWPATMPVTRGAFLSGELVRVNSGTLLIRSRETIEGPNGSSVRMRDFSVATDENTEFYLDLDPVTIQDLEPGMLVVCAALPPSGHHPSRLSVSASSVGMSGKIVRISHDSLAISTRNKDGTFKTENIALNKSVRVFHEVRKNGRARLAEGTIDDLKEGMQVHVVNRKGNIRIYIAPGEVVSNPTTKQGGD